MQNFKPGVPDYSTVHKPVGDLFKDANVSFIFYYDIC